MLSLLGCQVLIGVVLDRSFRTAESFRAGQVNRALIVHDSEVVFI